MLNRYAKRFATLKEKGAKIFMPFTLLGWPDRQTSLEIIRCMINNGASALELGIAFSDPVADGPVIAKAAFETLESGFRVTDAFKLLQDVRSIDSEIPVGLLVYYNVVLAFGVEAFFAEAEKAGVDGVLIADLPVENCDEVLPSSQKHNVDLIFIVSPVTPSDRLTKVAAVAGGFIYFVSRLGVTGTDKEATGLPNIKTLLSTLKERTDLPICAGFGVSNRANATALLDSGADGVIVGSRVIEVVRNSKGEFVAELKKLFDELNSACNSPVRDVSPAH